MWTIKTTDTFDKWYDTLDDTDRANVLASMIVLGERGPMLSRPYADTVNGSSYNNMKELRVQSKGAPIRAFFGPGCDKGNLHKTQAFTMTSC